MAFATFRLASGVGVPSSLAFDSSGILFAASSGNIYELAPDASQSTFATGLNNPLGLAFDSSGNLFEVDNGSGTINEFIETDGILSSTPTTIVSGLNSPTALAFEPAPEPSTWGLLATGMGFVLIMRRRFFKRSSGGKIQRRRRSGN